MQTSTFRIEKMDCPTEERLIRGALGDVAGVDALEFNLIARKLIVTHAEGLREAIVAAIAGVGMDAVPVVDPSRIELPVVEPSFWRQRATVATIVSGVAAVAAEALAWAVDERSPAVLVLAAVAIVTGGYQTAAKAWTALRRFDLNIHFLMALAVVGAAVIGSWTEAAMVIFLFAVAELVEAQSLNRARRAIRGLMHLAPQTAVVIRNGQASMVPADEVERGETVRVRPGDRLALDGRVTAGSSAVNQAPITGESMPVEKFIGDDVFAGSVNGAGAFDYEVTHIAGDSTIARIAMLVEQATARRGRTERFVDRFARYYTPAIFAVALVVAILPPLAAGASWHDWAYNGLVLLVIGCPCALVLSTPVTIVSGLAAAARRGILIKGGEFLERGRELRAIAFDKTGTLTEARPRVTDVEPIGIDADHLLHLAAAVEARSEHPIATAIIAEHELRHAGERETEASGFEALHGLGARAQVEGAAVIVGSHRLAHDLGLCSDAVESRLYALEAQGKTAVVVMNESGAIGVIGLADGVRATGAEAVGALHALGLRTAMLTGDNAPTAAAIAGSLGIDDVFADLLPEGKIDALDALERRHGGPVGMVGEGVNDVPALARASIGFVMGAAGSDVALDTAGVALMDDDLRKVPEFIMLSRRAIAVLKQNIAIALSLKAIFFALALAGQATLWMAVFADMGASLIVVANGLRLLGNTRQSAS